MIIEESDRYNDQEINSDTERFNIVVARGNNVNFKQFNYHNFSIIIIILISEK